MTLLTYVLCNHIWSPHCLPTYKPTELPVLHCVHCYFSPFLFSWPFFGHPSSVLRSELQKEPPTAPRRGPLLRTLKCRKQLCIPQLNISPVNNSMLLRVCHITEGMHVDPELGLKCRSGDRDADFTFKKGVQTGSPSEGT